MSARSEVEAAIAALERARHLLPLDPPQPPSSINIFRPGASSVALRDALRSVDPGTIIACDPTWRYDGNFELPDYPPGPDVKILSDFNVENQRADPSWRLATLASPNAGPTLVCEGAHDVTVIGLRLTGPRSQNEVIVCQNASKVGFDRVVVISDGDCKRGIRGNGQHIRVTRSHVANIVRQGQDSQAFCAWEGGPYLLEDSYFEASGENVMLGGADNPTSAATNPKDFIMRRCHLKKQPAWRAAFPGSVKNLFELKNATGVLVVDCLMEHSWTDAQDGGGVVWQPMNQDGGSPWTQLDNVRFLRCVVRGVEYGFSIIGWGYGHQTQQARNLAIESCLVQCERGVMKLGGEVADLSVEDNVFGNGGNIVDLYTGGKMPVEGQQDAAEFAASNLRWNRNAARHNEYGIKGDGTASGTAALDAFCRGYQHEANAYAGASSDPYPGATSWIAEEELQARIAARQASLALG